MRRFVFNPEIGAFLFRLVEAGGRFGAAKFFELCVSQNSIRTQWTIADFTMECKIDDSTRQVTRLWTLAQPKVSAFVTSVVRDFKDRDDVVQDIAVAVFESFDQYDPERPFIQWAMGVARNQFKNYLRQRKRHLAVFDPETIEALESAFADLPAAEIRELDFLQECLKKLDEKGLQLCDLRYRKGLKPAAISEAIKVSGTAVRKSLQRVREQLRVCVERKVSEEGTR